MSQGTLRFKEYSLLSIIDKALFLVIMIFLLVLKVEKALYYIIAYTSIRYLSLIYVYFSAKEKYKITANKRVSAIETKLKYVKKVLNFF